MVSEWMINGSIDQFVKTNPDVDRLELVRLLSASLSSLAANASVKYSQAPRRRYGIDLYA